MLGTGTGTGVWGMPVPSVLRVRPGIAIAFAVADADADADGRREKGGRPGGQKVGLDGANIKYTQTADGRQGCLLVGELREED